ncbi:hypothetical protein V6N11_025447 [Hibiscus sabdariffa]|uniref:Uncharacterized protein n=1 Tax=Hibiscus sabdariffa TaxID=183260 RepID=A0ABR2N9V8_9ROSI
MLLLCQRRPQGINDVIIRVYLSYFLISSYEIEALKSMFGSVMRSGFLCLCKGIIYYGNYNPLFRYEFFDPNSLFVASLAATYSAFVVESATVSCFEHF